MPTVKHKCPDTGKMMIKKFPYNAVGKVKLDQFMRDPRNKGAKIVSFHEMCITSYTFLQNLIQNRLYLYHKPLYPQINYLLLKLLKYLMLLF